LLYRDQILFRSDHVSCLFSLFFIPIAPRIHGSGTSQLGSNIVCRTTDSRAVLSSGPLTRCT
jgi:hypothetical protein